MSSLSFSASTVKSWFQYQCDRKTRYETMTPKERLAIPIIKDDEGGSWAEKGVAYEDAVVRELARDHKILVPDLGDQNLREALTAAFLRDETGFEFAHQAVLRGGERLRKYLGCHEDVAFRSTYPDLIRKVSDDPLTFRVIDIKATQRATYFHKTQVAFYALVLRATFADLGVHANVDAQGEIWHLKPGSEGGDGAYEIDSFRLKSYENVVRDFFLKTVERIRQQKVAPGRDETFFHIYYKCEGCAYLNHCRQAIDRPASECDVSAVPGLTQQGKRALQRFNIRRVKDLSESVGLTRQKTLHSWSLKRSVEALQERAVVLQAGECKRFEDRYTYLMPGRLDVGLYLVVDVDAVQDNLVTLGYLIERQEKQTISVEVIKEGSPDGEKRALKSVLGKFVADLRALDAENRELPEEQKLHAHIFLYEPSEAGDIKKALARHLDDDAIREHLLDLIRLFPPEEVVPEPEYRGIDHLPATALKSVMDQLYAIPVKVAYDLRQVTQALEKEGLEHAYYPAAGFERPFSSRLSIDVLRRLRERGTGVREVALDVQARLKALRGVTRWLLRENAKSQTPFLRLKKKPFALQEEFDPLNSGALEILRAHEMLSERSGMLSQLIHLAQPWRVRRDAMRCLAELRYRSLRPTRPYYRLTLGVPLESSDAEVGPDDFALILTNDDPDIRLDPTRWADYEVNIVASDGPETEVEVKFWFERAESIEELLTTSGDGQLFIDKAFKDFNTARIVTFLKELSQ